MDVQTSQLSNNTTAKNVNASGISTTLQESKEHLSALKSQISFAHQCLSLLQNQLNHAADTLGILQEQVVKAQDTMEHISVAPNMVYQPALPKGCNVHYLHPQCGAESMGPLVGATQDPNGKGLKQSNENVPEIRAGHLPCRTGAHSSIAPCQCSMCRHSPAVHQLAETSSNHRPHDGTATSASSQCQLSPEVQGAPYPTPVSSSCSDTSKPIGPPQGELSVKVEPNTVEETLTQGVTEQCDSFTPPKPAKLESSPMAHQLLQVIDVLQSADEDKSSVQGGASATQSTPPGRSVPNASHFESFADSSVDGRLLRAMPLGASMHSRPRKSRKPGLPLKLQATTGNTTLAAATADFQSPDLMRVPQPVLASTLPPEFLVVPATNYDHDSPSSKATAKNLKESGSSSNDGAVAITPFVTTNAEIATAGSSTSGVDGKAEKKGGEATVVTCLTHTTRKASADPSYSGHNIVKVNRCTSDASCVQAVPSSVGSSNCPVSSLISPQNGAQFISTSVRPTCTETMTTLPAAASRMRQHTEAEPALVQLNASEKHAPEGSSNGRAGAKKPIILSRRPSREQNIPEGVVVLVPTIEDAKRLIASTGGNTTGNTPVLIPRQMLNDIHSDKDCLHEGGAATLPAKRCFDSLSANEAPTKKLASMTEPLG